MLADFRSRNVNLSPAGESCGTCRHFRPHNPGRAYEGECRAARPGRGWPRWPQVDPRGDWCAEWRRDPTAGDDFNRQTRGEFEDEQRRSRKR